MSSTDIRKYINLMESKNTQSNIELFEQWMVKEIKSNKLYEEKGGFIRAVLNKISSMGIKPSDILNRIKEYSIVLKDIGSDLSSKVMNSAKKLGSLLKSNNKRIAKIAMVLLAVNMAFLASPSEASANSFQEMTTKIEQLIQKADSEADVEKVVSMVERAVEEHRQTVQSLLSDIKDNPNLSSPEKMSLSKDVMKSALEAEEMSIATMAAASLKIADLLSQLNR